MKAIIYYSLSGTTKKECEELFEGDFYRLKGKIRIPKKYWMQLVYLGFLATMNTKLDYDKLDIDLDQYDEVVLASPVWAWTIVPFLKKFLKRNKFKNKRVTLLVTHEGGPGRVMKRFKRYLDSSNTLETELSIRKGSKYESATILKK
jgi:flavodoxin